jgi:anaerobic sulfite reductase subunit C
MRTDFSIHMKGGIITERDADFCTIRIRAPAGNISVEKLRGLTAIAKKYGSGTIHCTTRQTIEIPHVDPSKSIKKIAKGLLQKNGTPVGSEKR